MSSKTPYLNTVNIIATRNETHQIESLHSFPDTIEGNKDAEMIFKQKAGRLFPVWYNLTDEDKNDIMNDGYFCGVLMTLSIVHSD